MRFFRLAASFVCVALTASLQAGILPTLHLQPQTVEVFDRYIAQFEKNVEQGFVQSGHLWIDGHSCCMRGNAFASSKPIVEARENSEVDGGSIHHFSGAIHVNGGTIADVRRIMQDYTNYPTYFKPDVAKGSGAMQADSTPENEHFISKLNIVEATLWLGVAYDSTYDTHYRLVDPHRWASHSVSAGIKEWRDPKDFGKGYFPEGEDHGFLWRTNTYWFVREANGGVDMELDSITLSRPVPTGFSWWGSKRTHDAVDKMLRDMKNAIDALHSRG
jgi:hypothetical protein